MIAPVAILAVAAALGGVPEAEVTCHRAPQFNKLVMQYFPEDNDPWRTLAFANVGDPRIWFRQGTCRVLKEVADGRMKHPWHWRKVGYHALILGHEVAHNIGIRREGKADCWGALKAGRVARMLGHPKPERVKDWAVWLSSCKKLQKSRFGRVNTAS